MSNSEASHSGHDSSKLCSAKNRVSECLTRCDQLCDRPYLAASARTWRLFINTFTMAASMFCSGSITARRCGTVTHRHNRIMSGGSGRRQGIHGGALTSVRASNTSLVW